MNMKTKLLDLIGLVRSGTASVVSQTLHEGTDEERSDEDAKQGRKTC